MYKNRQFYFLKLKQAIRNCSTKSLSSDKLSNRHLKATAYQPKFFETNREVSSKQNLSACNGETFSMIFPPPNVTGNIHLGHALTATIQDVLIRWKQKQNVETRWIPGMDHAGIATQVVVEKILFKRENKTRHELGKEKFLEEVWKWRNEKSKSIKSDLRKLGTSFDWNKEYFTMDENLCGAVNEAFIKLFEKDLIYRDESLINWCCSLESAISDVEVDNLEIQGRTEIAVPGYDKKVTFGVITDIAYKIVGSSDEIVVSTTRPETLLGDVAVAVHPNDPRFAHLRDTELWHPYRNETIPLIFDESVDREFGTGAVKITPAHDKNDLDVSKRHKLRHVQVISSKGLITEGFEGFTGLPRFVAREKILNDLAVRQLFRGSNEHSMVLPICSRSKDVIEFLLRPQWFVKCSEMSQKAIEVVERGELKIHPKTFEKEWYRWLTNCRDWCISRQLVWGHQIPAYKINGETWIAAKSPEEAERKFKEKFPETLQVTLERDQDVLDTWFSSGLLPFSVFNWPNENEEFKKFFPLDLLETGHDILFFWVARMVMLSMELTGKIPFKEVLLHGIICDSYGRKMSKSLGNVIAPDQIINGATIDELQKETEASVKKGILSESELEKSLDGQRRMFPYGIKECGIDSLRFTLLSHNIKHHFISFDVTDAHTNRNFFNKIYQAVKFANILAEQQKVVIMDIKNLKGLELSEMDRWLLSRLGKTLEIVEQSMDNYSFHTATAALKTFLYDNLCNVYLETTKMLRTKKNSDKIACSSKVLNVALAVSVNYLEPFTPFLASELKLHLPMNCEISLESYIDDVLEKRIQNVLEICESIREMKAECRITRKIPSEIQILIKSKSDESFLKSHEENIQALTQTDDLQLTTNAELFEAEDFIALSTAGPLCSFGIRTLGKNSVKIENSLNQKKFVKLENELINLMNAVNNDGYRLKASEKVQEKHKAKIDKLKKELENIRSLG